MQLGLTPDGLHGFVAHGRGQQYDPLAQGEGNIQPARGCVRVSG